MRLPFARKPDRLADAAHAAISASLRALRPGGRLSLARGPGALTEHYIQVIRTTDAYLVDIRDGSAEDHLQATVTEVTDVKKIWSACTGTTDEWRSLAQWTKY